MQVFTLYFKLVQSSLSLNIVIVINISLTLFSIQVPIKRSAQFETLLL